MTTSTRVEADLAYGRHVRTTLATNRAYAVARWTDPEVAACCSSNDWAHDCVENLIRCAMSPTAWSTTPHTVDQVAVVVAMFAAAYQRAGGDPDQLRLPPWWRL